MSVILYDIFGKPEYQPEGVFRDRLVIRGWCNRDRYAVRGGRRDVDAVVPYALTRNGS